MISWCERVFAVLVLSGLAASSPGAEAGAGAPVFPAAAGSSAQALRPGYAGDAACFSCHQEIAGRYLQTAHARTSSVGSAETILGSFHAGANILATANPDLHFEMEARVDGPVQTAILRTSPTRARARTEKFDVVVGSGRKGQTYLYWKDDLLFQLPVSYWSESASWVNSPGYVDGHAQFDRPIPERCLECHASAFVSRAPPRNRFARDSLQWGISCENCHGPGAEHVARYRSASPAPVPTGAAIVNPAKLNRDRQMDVCGLCHAGPGAALTPPLSFVPGDNLANHIVFPELPPGAPVDVHASQVQLLQRSRCFQHSPTMSCNTCHNVHQQQRDLSAMAAHCATCHQVEDCGQFSLQGRVIAAQCVTCHMPLEATAQIVFSPGTGRQMQPRVRNHRIAIYPEVKLP